MAQRNSKNEKPYTSHLRKRRKLFRIICIVLFLLILCLLLITNPCNLTGWIVLAGSGLILYLVDRSDQRAFWARDPESAKTAEREKKAEEGRKATKR